jgi:penicillin-binding protein 1A
VVTGVWFGLDDPAPIMARGFASTVAVPAWASFMKAATRGATKEWFEMPPGIEEVQMCRLSGRRAIPSCRYNFIPSTPSETSASGIVQAAYVSAQPLPAPVAPVYTDIFPEGAVASETCEFASGLPESGVTRLIMTPRPDRTR